jgi:hypothetical protein
MAIADTIADEKDARQPKENAPFKRDDEGYATVTFKIKSDALYSLLKLLKQCEYMGNIGHSFIDPRGQRLQAGGRF